MDDQTIAKESLNIPTILRDAPLVTDYSSDEKIEEQTAAKESPNTQPIAEVTPPTVVNSSDEITDAVAIVKEPLVIHTISKEVPALTVDCSDEQMEAQTIVDGVLATAHAEVEKMEEDGRSNAVSDTTITSSTDEQNEPHDCLDRRKSIENDGDTVENEAAPSITANTDSCDTEVVGNSEPTTLSSPTRQTDSESCDEEIKQTFVSKVLIISSKEDEAETPTVKPVAPMTLPEKKVKKVERAKSKPAPPPLPPSKINRDECDWDSLFDDNGDCLDPTLIEEVSFGNVTISYDFFFFPRIHLFRFILFLFVFN